MRIQMEMRSGGKRRLGASASMGTDVNAAGKRFIQTGFTRIELVIAILCFGILICMLLPATRSTRESARRISCTNNLRQIAFAGLNYESEHGHFPAAMGSLDDGSNSTRAGDGRLSGLVMLLPFMEQAKLWDQVSQPSEFNGVEYPAGPHPRKSDYPPWHEVIPVLQCPSSMSGQSEFAQTNYTFCIGDMARQIHRPSKTRGAYACGIKTRLDDIKDGSSNTIALAEMGTSKDRSIVGKYAIHLPASILDNPTECLKVVSQWDSKRYDDAVKVGSPGRGGCWADGSAGVSLFNTVLPPNSPSCAVGGAEAVDGIYSAGGFHVGGVNVVMVDGSCRFINQEIDAGDSGEPTLTEQQMSNAPTPSPYGVWGALGTAAGDDSIEE